MSKISELSDGGSIQSGDTLIAVRSGGNVKVTYGGTTTANIDGGTIDGTVIGGSSAAAGSFTTITASGEITANGGIALGDNDMATFGASDDLQIYHDGSNSYIVDGGTGDLLIRGSSNMKLQSFGANNFITMAAGGATTVYHANNPKLATTSTGIDVTGTVTADGLTVDNNSSTPVSINRDQAIDGYGIVLNQADTTDGNGLEISYQTTTTGTVTPNTLFAGIDFTADNHNWSTREGSIQLKTAKGGVGYKTRMNVAGNGDISFYEDTGTTAKFFWDASAESLGIGTTSPDALLEVSGASAGELELARFRLEGATNNPMLRLFSDEANKLLTIGTSSSVGGEELAFDVNNTERMRIDSSGSVGIGTQSPASIVGGTDTSPVLSIGGTDSVLVTGDKAGSVSFITNDGSYTVTYSDGVTGEIASVAETDFGAAYGLAFYTGITTGSNRAERMRIDSFGNVGIGTTSPDATGLHITRNTGNAELRLTRTGTFTGDFKIYSGGGATNRLVFRDMDVNSDRLTIDSSGNLLVGKTADNITDLGVVIAGDGSTSNFTSGSTSTARFNRLTSDGTIIDFRKDGTTVGSIGTDSGDLTVGTGTAGIKFQDATNRVFPWNTTTNTASDDTHDLGTSSVRWQDIYATNGTIQTSDANEKQDIDVLSEAEQRVAVAAKGLLRKFRWKSAVAEKGDDARIHFGIIAQDLQAAFEAEGLDAGRYAMFIHSTWTDEETGEERSRMGVRYSELLAFIIAAI